MARAKYWRPPGAPGAIEGEGEWYLPEHQRPILAEFLRAIGQDAVAFTEAAPGASFGGGDSDYVFHVEIGGITWDIALSDDAARETALEEVRHDLKTNPEMFDQRWLTGHVDEKSLRGQLRRDVYDSHYDRLENMDPAEFIQEAERHGLEVPEEDEAGEIEISSYLLDRVADAQTEETLENPVQYLEEIYGTDDAPSEAIRIAGIDLDAAAEDAVSTDGWQNFLARYDGHSYELPSGAVYWRA